METPLSVRSVASYNREGSPNKACIFDSKTFAEIACAFVTRDGLKKMASSSIPP